ncbi:conserved hypothetical protein [Dethiobacter alkaliphilus AHT 1]|uniref:Uncharacterized protein n=2 Tax=Dethiobacter TaxID=427925 RepID=C0GKH2_DETAL|nr:conserved hypothetical protein [Dethiobacter alkaliphilus AHT 1]
MFIQYDEYELLELFESEPILIAEKEAGMFIYSLSNALGFKLVMSLSVYENQCNVSLSYVDDIIFDIQLSNVKSMKSDGKQIRINRKENKIDVIIGFKPNFSLRIDNI